MSLVSGACAFVRGETRHRHPRLPPTAMPVSQLWVARRQRESGLGRELMNAVTRWAIEHDARQIFLGVTQSKLGVQKFCENLVCADQASAAPSNPAVQLVVMR
jgi:GNAT superfamily N-acetyltransferase